MSEMNEHTEHVPLNPDDPVSREAGRAIAHLNTDHNDALLDMARALAGCPDATAVPAEHSTAGSRSATIAPMATIPQKELRNQVGEVLRRAESGEELTITVSGRPVAVLGPALRRRWIPSEQLAELWRAPADPTLGADLEQIGGDLVDPWSE
jgi:prevent-host-death family protein